MANLIFDFDKLDAIEAKPFTLCITGLAGDLCSFEADSSFTISDVKSLVAAKLHIPAEEQQLLLGTSSVNGVGPLHFLFPSTRTLHLTLLRCVPVDQWIRKIHCDTLVLRDAPESIRSNRDIVVAVVEQCGAALAHAAEELRSDHSIVFVAVQNDGLALQHATNALKADAQVVSAAVTNNWLALEHAGVSMRGDAGIVGVAMRNNPAAFEFAMGGARANRDLALAAVSSNWELLASVSPNLKSDRKLVELALSQSGNALQHAAPSIRTNKRLVLAAVQNHGSALQFASDSLRGDPDVVLAALRNSAASFRFATEAITRDVNVIASAMTYNPQVLRYVPEDLLYDSRVLAKADELRIFEDAAFDDLLWISPETAQRHFPTQGVIFVDTRDRDSFEICHVKGSWSVPADLFRRCNLPNWQSYLEEPIIQPAVKSPDLIIVVYSELGAIGSRCSLVADILRARRELKMRRRVLRLQGGLQLWKSSGFPVAGKIQGR